MIPKRTTIFAALLAALAAFVPHGGARTAIAACAFNTAQPTTYETTQDRRQYMTAMDLAGYNMLFSGDNFFSQLSIGTGTRANRSNSSDVFVPPTLLKAISWIESSSTNGAPSVPFGSVGPVLVSFDCGYGISQVTSGMTTPLGENGEPTDEQALVGTHFAYNIGRGAAILIDKWNAAPSNRPIAGIDTNSDPRVMENWYYAVWSYNGFTGPGANRSNHPLDPVYPAWPRTPYSCGNAGDGLGHNRSLYPYQELVYGCAAHPPSVLGAPLWTPAPVTLPDLNNPYWRRPLSLTNFRYPYSAMDIPTPKPQHTDPTPPPSLLGRLYVVGLPQLSVGQNIVLVNVRPGQSSTPATVRISNAGTGIVPWKATVNKSWVTVSAQAGVAIGAELTCNPGSPCDRSATLTISVDPRAIQGSDCAVLHIQGLGGAWNNQDVAIFVRTNVALGIPGTSKN